MPDAAAAKVRPVAGALMVVYVLVVAVIVFTPDSDFPTDSVAGIWAVLSAWGVPDVFGESVEFVTNVLLFVPLSLLGAAFRPHWRWPAWLAAGLAGTLLIETGQALFLPDRSAELVDIVANTLGALLGYLLSLLVRRLWPAERAGRG